MERNWRQGVTESDTILEDFKGEFITINTRLDRQRKDLRCLELTLNKTKNGTEAQFQDVVFIMEENQALHKRIEHLEEEGREKDVYLDGLAMSTANLIKHLNNMEGRLCHCSDGKGKGKEIVKMEVDDNRLVYESEEGEYHLAPVTPGPVMTKLIPIAQDPEGGEVKEEGFESCGCGLEDHSIVISNNNITVAENTVAIPM